MERTNELSLCLDFIDLEKVFDLVLLTVVGKLLEHQSNEGSYIKLIQNMYLTATLDYTNTAKNSSYEDG